jgi:hypothetical protein
VADGLHKRQHGTCVVDEALFGEGRDRRSASSADVDSFNVGKHGPLLATAPIVP